MEDVVLPNREWAKLVGLPSCEVFRCEQAVGVALKLWQPGQIDECSQEPYGVGK